MFASTDRRALRQQILRGARILGVALVVLVLTGAAVRSGDDDDAAPRAGIAVAAAPVAAAGGTGGQTGRYVMRCWQYGRLLFEETLSRLPAEAEANVIRLLGADRAQSPYHLVDTRTAVCLAKPVLDRGGWPVVNLPGRG